MCSQQLTLIVIKVGGGWRQLFTILAYNYHPLNNSCHVRQDFNNLILIHVLYQYLKRAFTTEEGKHQEIESF